MKKFIFIVILFIIHQQASLALIEVDITRGNLDPLPIAVSPFYVESNSAERDLSHSL